MGPLQSSQINLKTICQLSPLHPKFLRQLQLHDRDYAATLASDDFGATAYTSGAFGEEEGEKGKKEKTSLAWSVSSNRRWNPERFEEECCCRTEFGGDDAEFHTNVAVSVDAEANNPEIREGDVQNEEIVDRPVEQMEDEVGERIDEVEVGAGMSANEDLDENTDEGVTRETQSATFLSTS